MEAAAVQALVIVDVQAVFVTGGHAVPEAETLIARIAGLLARARQAGSLLIHLQNDGRPGTEDEPGQPGWELQLPPAGTERVIRKAHDDGFRGTALASTLLAHRVKRLALAGVMSEMCVSATARSALEKGFGVVLPHDAHATCDIPAAPGLGVAVPAAIVARVTEWALGDEIELVRSAAPVTFTAPGT